MKGLKKLSLVLVLLCINILNAMDQKKGTKTSVSAYECINQTETKTKKPLRDCAALLWGLAGKKSPAALRGLDPRDLVVGKTAARDLPNIVFDCLKGDYHLLAMLDETNGGHTRPIGPRCQIGNEIIITGSQDASIKILRHNPQNPFDLQCLCTLNQSNGGHANPITALITLTPTIFASAAYNTIRIWHIDPMNLSNVKCQAVFDHKNDGHRGVITDLCAAKSDSADYVKFASLTRDLIMKTWKVNVTNPENTTCEETWNLNHKKFDDNPFSSMRSTSIRFPGLYAHFDENKIKLYASVTWLLKYFMNR